MPACLADALDAVRRSLVHGWSQHGCRDASGFGCTDDVAHTFDLVGAVEQHAGPFRLAVWDRLDEATDGTSYLWSLEPGRTHREVLAMVARATKRAEQEAA